MANLKFSSDLINDALFRANEPTDGTSDYESQALVYLNRAYQVIWNGGQEFDPELNEKWWWLRKTTPGTLTLEPYRTTGTVTVTQNSTSITFSSAPSASVANWHFKVDGTADVFRISSHTAASTSATLDSVFTSDSGDGSGKNYKLFKVEYDLASDFMEFYGPMRVYQDNKDIIEMIDESQMDIQFPLRDIESGVPDYFCMVGTRKIRFNKYGLTTTSEYIRADYSYLYIPDDLTDSGSEEPAVPREHRRVLADMVCFWLKLDKGDSDAEQVGAMARSGLRAMARENRRRQQQATPQTFGRIHTRPRSVLRRPLRTESGNIIG